MGIDETVRSYLSEMQLSSGIMGHRPGESGHEEEFATKYDDTVGLIEVKLLEHIAILADPLIKALKSQPNTHITYNEVRLAIIDPLKQMVNRAKLEYVRLREQGQSVDGAFDKSMMPVGALIEGVKVNFGPYGGIVQSPLDPAYIEGIKQRLQPLVGNAQPTPTNEGYPVGR